MNRTGLFTIACSAFLASVFAHPAPARAGEGVDPLKATADLKSQFIGEDNGDLGTAVNEDFQDSESLEAKARVTAGLSENVNVLLEGRMAKNYGAGGPEDPNTGEPSGQADFFELRQAWAEYEGKEGYNFKIGRQRISDPYTIWWNRDFDSVRASYDSTLLSGFVAVGQNLTTYKSTHDDFNEDDEDILRILAEGVWQWRYDQFIEGRGLFQNDYSGMEDVGSLILDGDRDSEDADLFWGGVRMRGKSIAFFGDATEKPDYRIDLMGVGGERDVQSSAAATGGLRTVTAVDTQDVLGWALDAGLTVPLPLASDPNVILGYAFGSGDDDAADDNDGAFRQTGLHGNFSRPGLSSESVNSYGSALRPELSNIHIFTAGLGVPVTDDSDISLIYHRYRLDESATGLRSSGIDAPLNGLDNDLGQAVDLVFGSDIGKELGLSYAVPKQIKFKTTIGVFSAGDAYGAADGENAFRALVEFRLRL